MQGQDSGALMWFVADQWVHWPCGFPGGTGQGQPPSVFSLGPPCLSCKASEMAATCVGLGDSQVKPSCVNLGWMLLVLGLGLTEA